MHTSADEQLETSEGIVDSVANRDVIGFRYIDERSIEVTVPQVPLESLRRKSIVVQRCRESFRSLCSTNCLQTGYLAQDFPALLTHSPQFKPARRASRLIVRSLWPSGFPSFLGR